MVWKFRSNVQVYPVNFLLAFLLKNGNAAYKPPSDKVVTHILPVIEQNSSFDCLAYGLSDNYALSYLLAKW